MVISNKENFLEKFALFVFFIVIFSFAYFNIGGLFILLLFLILILLFLLSSDFRKSIKKNYKSNFLFIILFLLLFFNVLITEKTDYLFSNLNMLFRSIFVYYIIIHIYLEDNNVFEEFIKSKFLIFNFFWILNIIILFFQVNGIPLLMKSEWFLINPMYEDHCSGLFGFSGTHYLAFYSIFILLYNFYYSSTIFNSSKKLLLNGYNIFSAILMVFLSTLNDNNSIFVLYFVFIIYYFLKKSFIKKNIFNVLSKLFIFSVIFIIFVMILKSIPFISNYLDSKLFKLLENLINYNYNSVGSSERLAIFFNALENHNGYLFGLGFGSWTLNEQSYLGFKHFGISSIGTITTLCGIWIYCILLLLFSSLSKGKYNYNLFFKILNIFVFVILSIYTVVFYNYIILIILSFIFCVLDLIDKKVV